MDTDRYSAANERYVQWHMDRRTALMQAIEGMGIQKDIDLAWEEEADSMFAWLRGQDTRTVAEADTGASTEPSDEGGPSELR